MILLLIGARSITGPLTYYDTRATGTPCFAFGASVLPFYFGSAEYFRSKSPSSGCSSANAPAYIQSEVPNQQTRKWVDPGSPAPQYRPAPAGPSCWLRCVPSAAPLSDSMQSTHHERPLLHSKEIPLFCDSIEDAANNFTR